MHAWLEWDQGCLAGGENGFSQAIELASDTLSNVKFVQEKRLISKFFDEISQVGPPCRAANHTLPAATPALCLLSPPGALLSDEQCHLCARAHVQLPPEIASERPFGTSSMCLKLSCFPLCIAWSCAVFTEHVHIVFYF